MAVTEAEQKNIAKHRSGFKNKDIKFKLKYYYLSCGFMDVYAYLIKREPNKLIFKGRDNLVFVAQK